MAKTEAKVLPDLQAQIAALRAENERLAAAVAAKNTVSMKVSEKGALSIYGLGRFPVTLYASQWDTLLAKADAIRAFIEANKATLATKPTK